MLNTLVSIKSYLGTLMIFIAFIVSFITLVATYNQPNVKYLLFPLVVSFGIAVLNSVVYMRSIIDMKEGVYTNDVAIKLESCPEYWIKDTMYNNGDKVNVCKNYFTDDKGKMNYVGGSAKTNGKFFDNFKGDGDSNLTETLSNMNASNVETFVDYSASKHNAIRTSYDDNNVNKLVAFSESNLDSFSNSNLSDIPGSHYHFISSMTHHDNDTHSNIDNMEADTKWHWHENNADISQSSVLPSDCTDKWICKEPIDGGIIVNLDKLNDNYNKCGNADKFYWVEASNKCRNNSIQ